MADNLTNQQRKFNMSQIKGKNTTPEVIVRKFLFSHGFRYRINVKKLPGTPDIVLSKYKTVIFINGCFWHGHEGCRYFTLPKTRAEWWKNKINSTKQRDEKSYTLLKEDSWNIIIIWECELKKTRMLQTLSELHDNILENLTS